MAATPFYASAAQYNFSNLGTASGGFKPQGNRFLVSETFLNDNNSMYYNDGTNAFVTGMVIKPDGTHLASFDLGNLTISPYSGTYTVSITITADLKAGGTTSQSVSNYGLTAATSLTTMGMNFSAFNDVTELRIDLTVQASQVWNINFDTITITDEQAPVAPGTTPTVQATNLKAASNGTAVINMYWQNGNGSNRIVFAKQGNTGTPTVTDGAVYSADSDFGTATDIGGGWKCVFRDTGHQLSITGLAAGTEYRIVVYEFDGTGGGEAYLTSIGTNIMNHSTSPAGIDKKDFSSLGTASGGFKPQGNRYLVSEAFTNDGTSMYYNSTNASETGIVIKPNGTSLQSFDLVDLEFSPYSADRVITVTVTADLKAGGTTSQTVSNFTMYHGIPYSLSLMGMDFSAFNDVTELRFDITTDQVQNINFANISITDPDEYVVGTEPTVQVSNLKVASAGTSVINSYWDNGNGTKRIVFVTAGNTGTPTVTDGTVYDANSDFSAATDIGSGWKCVYKGAERCATISGLAAGTEYRMVVYEFDGAGGGENYLTTTGLNIINHATDPAGIAKYDFSTLGSASGGFKPQDNRFLVAEAFVQDGTKIYYNSSNETATGIVIKPDGTHLLTFDLVDMEFSPYTADRTVSITATADLSAGGTVSQSISNFTMINGIPYSLGLLGLDFSAFDDVTELRFDITVTGSSVNLLNFENITLADQRTPGTPPTVTTQAVTGIGTTTATGNGNITDLGAPDPTAHGVCWNTGGAPTTADNHTDEGAAAATGAFTSGLTGLSPNTNYYVRAYATNTTGTVYGIEVSFTTAQQAPTITTQAVTGVGTTTATGNGNITDLGAPDPTAHGVCWNTGGVPTTADSHTDEGAAAATGAFTSGLTGLSPNTTYYVRVYATNTAGTRYGNEVTFKTKVALTMALMPAVGGATAPTAGTTTNMDAGSVQNISASPTTGYHFDYWTATPSASAVFGNAFGASTTVTLNGSAMVTAAFSINSYALNYVTGPNGSISGMTPQTVTHGSDGKTVEALPGAGYHFVGWSDGSTANPRTDVYVTANISVHANFEKNTYTLTVNNGTGDGVYPSEDVVTISANAPPVGQIFDRWTGNTGNVDNIILPNTTVTIPEANITVTATYKTQGVTTYTLSVTHGTGGGDYLPGNTVPITADIPPAAQVFDRWTGDTDGIANINLPDTTLTMPAAATSVAATYKDQGVTTYPLTVKAGTGSGDYLPGHVVFLSAGTPPTGYVFYHWTGDTDTIANINVSDTTLVMPSAATAVTAEFKPQEATTYALTVTGGAGSGNYLPGETVAISATLPAGYTFTQWSGQTAWLADIRQTDTTLIMPDADIAIEAMGQINNYILAYTAGANGIIAGTTPQMVNHGADGTAIEAVPDAGYRFVEWSDGVTTANRTDTNIIGDVAVTAMFAVNEANGDIPFDLDLDGNGIPDIDQTNIRIVADESNGLYFSVAIPNNIDLDYLRWIDPSTIPDMTNRPDKFPLGLLAFRVLTALPGDTIELTIYCSQPIPEGMFWYKHDAVTGWYDFSDNATVSDDRYAVMLRLQDGGYGDADGIINGAIEDPSGPALFDDDGSSDTGHETDDPDHGTNTDSSSSGGNGSSCFLNSLFNSGHLW